MEFNSIDSFLQANRVCGFVGNDTEVINDIEEWAGTLEENKSYLFTYYTESDVSLKEVLSGLTTQLNGLKDAANTNNLKVSICSIENVCVIKQPAAGHTFFLTSKISVVTY